MREFTATKNDAGQRLDRFVSKTAPLLPDSLLQKYIRTKRIKLNGKGSKRDVRVAQGDVISMYINDEFFEPPTDDNAFRKISAARLNTVYEDDNILLVDKRPGVLCHSAGTWTHDTLIANIQAHVYQSGGWDPRGENAFAPALCNRIDRNTGGIVIAAKNAEALRIINEKIQNREIDKYYLCIVHGRLSPPEGRLEDYIFKDASKNQVYVRHRSEPGAKSAVTEYRTLASQKGLSLVECRLLTGRTHQIRAQMSAAGHPLLGDGKYGSQRQDRDYGEKRQALYSYRLIFSFESDAGILEYLKHREFSVEGVEFVNKYFPEYFTH